MKFRTDVTQGGYKILSLHGPDTYGWFAGVVEHNQELAGLVWGKAGSCLADNIEDDAYNLIPLADEPAAPKRDMAMETLEHALKEINQRFDDFDKRLAAEMKRNDGLYQDAVARVNGLRNDYLADKDAVSPDRVADLEERLDKFDDELGVLQNDVNRDLRLALRDLTKRLEALEQLNKGPQPSDVGAKDKKAPASEQSGLPEETEQTGGVHVNQDLRALHNRILKLEQRDTNLPQTGPMCAKSIEKGVWVTKDRFWGAWCEVNPVGLTSGELFQRIAKRLGLEE